MMQTDSASTDEDMINKEMRATERGENGESCLLRPFWHSTTRSTPTWRCNAFLRTGLQRPCRRRGSLHLARPSHGEGACLGPNRTAATRSSTLRRLAVNSDDPGSTAQVPTDDVHRPAYVAACCHATRVRIAALRKRRHRGHYQRSRDEAHTTLLASPNGCYCSMQRPEKVH